MVIHPKKICVGESQLILLMQMRGTANGTTPTARDFATVLRVT